MSISPVPVSLSNASTAPPPSFASLASQIGPVESIRPQHVEPTEASAMVKVFDLDEEGERLSDFWTAWNESQQMYHSIRDLLQSESSRLLQDLTPDDLFEWLYPDLYQQYQGYIEYQEL